MGYYRLLLALCVACSHIVAHPYIDEGRVAVISFFLISGHAIYNLLSKKYASFSGIINFYFDRILRIYPLFLFFALLTAIFIYMNDSNVGFHHACSIPMIGLNLMVVPLYFQNQPWHLCTLLPQSWSLSLELFFYSVAPFIVLFWSRGFVALVCVASLWVYGQSFLGIIDTDQNGFRHLPGTLYIFVLGMSFARDERFWKMFRWSFWVAACVLAAVMYATPDLRALNSNQEILVGLIIGIPALAFLRTVPSSKPEQFAGHLSYAVFLCHYLVYVAVLRFFDPEHQTTIFAVVAILSILAGTLGHIFIERPVLLLRRKIRTRFQPVTAEAG